MSNREIDNVLYGLFSDDEDDAMDPSFGFLDDDEVGCDEWDILDALLEEITSMLPEVE